MAAENSKIVYTLTDEAPLLATASFLPIIRTFAATGWFVNMRDETNITDSVAFLTLTRDQFLFGRNRCLPKITTECLITDHQEKQLTDNGFIALCDQPHNDKTTFYSNQSVK